jgi:SAM-dependent methyltransferase
MPDKEWTLVLKTGRPYRLSELCKAEDKESGWYQRWCSELQEEPRFHRKQWEYVYILEALWERNCIKTGKKGLVFALPSLMASHGCQILATDIFPAQGVEKGWAATDQLCFGIESLNTRKLCDESIMGERVTYRPVDMNNIPPDLENFDFNWSSCSFEHLGSIEKGLHFLRNQLRTLKPGGWAVHTTEYNVSSEELTQDNNDTVIFRRKDIEGIVTELRNEGHFVEELDLSFGGMPEDYQVDTIPHEQKVHLKLQIDRFVVTSLGLIIRKKQ